VMTAAQCDEPTIPGIPGIVTIIGPYTPHALAIHYNN
jgi:hypothetical protein